MILVADVNETSSATINAPDVEFIAVTKGTELKLVPVIVTAVCVFSITDGLIPETVGLSFCPPRFTDPPNETDCLIVTAEFVKALFGIVLVEAPDTKFPNVLALLIFYLAVHGTLFEPTND